MNLDPDPAHPVVAVTGAGQGIGRGLAHAFARAGMRVVVSDIRADAAEAVARELREAGAQALAQAADIGDAGDCAALADAAVRRFGRLDTMVCNAGLMQIRPLMELEASDWDRLLRVNVTGTFLSLQAAARRMRQQEPSAPGQPRGRIIAMASIAGRSGAGPIAGVIAPYRASKAAVISLVQSAAVALAPEITVNAICPGLVDTDMWKRMDRDWGALQGKAPGEIWRQRIEGIPMGRAQQPEDVAGLALYLASPAAAYMTGQSINIDGGLMMN
jgi:meso-butanediol dehydrogenase/(S,S)-butanediol dehydrogenase/diacetyl reductase